MGRKKNTETEIITPVEEIETVEEQDVIGQAWAECMKDMPEYTSTSDFMEIAPDMVKRLQSKRQELRKKQMQADNMTKQIFGHLTAAYELSQEVEKI